MLSHTVPRCLLDQFAYDDPVTKSRRLWQYAKGRAPWGFASPSSATRVEHHFEDPSDPVREEKLEERLNREIENPVHRFLPLLRYSDTFPLQRHYVRHLTRYITLLFNRSQNRKDGTREQVQILIDSMQALFANDAKLSQVAAHWTIRMIQRGFAPEEAIVSVELVRERISEAIEEMKTEQHIKTTYVDSMERALAYFDQRLANGAWKIIPTTISNPFIIGDAPVVTWVRRSNGILDYGLGFERPDVEVLLPVCPTACLHILPEVQRTRGAYIPTAREVNEAQASFSTEYCYANTDDPALDQIVQPHLGTRKIGINAFSVRHRNYEDTIFELLMSDARKFQAPKR